MTTKNKIQLSRLDHNHPLIRIQPSPIDRLGIFAIAPISKGTKITYFTGVEISREEFKSKYGTDLRCVYVRPSFIPRILHSKDHKNLINFVNSPVNTPFQANCYLKNRWLIASTDLPVGSELLLNYPAKYFESYWVLKAIRKITLYLT